MKLFYCCYGGAHTSVTCASIHLGYLPSDRIPESYEFRKVPFYEKMDHHKLGTPVLMGKDELGCDVYILGLKNAKQVAVPALKSYLNLCGVDQKSYLLINALVELHPVTSIGGVVSRKFGVPVLGRPMTIWGIRRTYPRFVKLVENVKENLRHRQELS